MSVFLHLSKHGLGLIQIFSMLLLSRWLCGNILIFYTIGYMFEYSFQLYFSQEIAISVKTK